MFYVKCLVVLITLIIPISSLLPPDDNSCNTPCFHQPPEACPPINDKCKCRQLSNCRKAAICCNVVNTTLMEELKCANINWNTDIESLHIRNATFESFNLSLSQAVWRLLHHMTITDGNIYRIDGKFPKFSDITCLNLSSNHINSVEDSALSQLKQLSLLDLSHNNLTEIPSIPLRNVTLDISNNSNLACSKLKLLLNQNTSKITFINVNDTVCITSKDFDWFQAIATLPFSQVKAVHELQENCIMNCTCDSHRLIFHGKLASFEVAVNCSGKQYFSLPFPLPPNTILLDVSNNNITSIKELDHATYENLRYFYADNNQISSIQPLEGTKFINNFDTLSLQNNRIKLLETYVLDSIQFERNFNQRKVRLGFNKLKCDCNTKQLKVWLLSKLSHIPDHDDIRCENMNVKVIELDPSKLCQSPQDWTDYIYYIITAEVLLLVGLIAKVSYDYWVFKTAGYLPWPANKMPRLPCDWLCE